LLFTISSGEFLQPLGLSKLLDSFAIDSLNAKLLSFINNLSVPIFLVTTIQRMPEVRDIFFELITFSLILVEVQPKIGI
jgi:hypothetical protein